MGAVRNIGLMLGCLIATLGRSSDAATGSITIIAPDGANVSFGTAGTRDATPSCATDPLWIVPGSSAPLMAMIMSAYFTGRSFEVHGSGSCAGGVRETVAYIVLI